MLLTDTPVPLQSKADLLSPYLIIMQLQDMLHTSFIAVFLFRHMNLTLIPEYLILLKIFMFQPAFFLFIGAADGSHIIFKGPLNPHIAHVAVALEPFALQAAGSLKSLFKDPPAFIGKPSIIIIKGFLLPHGNVNPHIIRMMLRRIPFFQQPFGQQVIFLIILFHLNSSLQALAGAHPKIIFHTVPQPLR